mmetsp:Transcript_107920/g.344499  ORF Transcript_107920/g.344499 Transcript_107920/m.344499 type:complete len:225 (-) Transcript_107920:427-1101(-)
MGSTFCMATMTPLGTPEPKKGAARVAFGCSNALSFGFGFSFAAGFASTSGWATTAASPEGCRTTETVSLGGTCACKRLPESPSAIRCASWCLKAEANSSATPALFRAPNESSGESSAAASMRACSAMASSPYAAALRRTACAASAAVESWAVRVRVRSATAPASSGTPRGGIKVATDCAGSAKAETPTVASPSPMTSPSPPGKAPRRTTRSSRAGARNSEGACA